MNRCRVILTLGLLLAGCSPSNLSREVTRSAIDEGTQQLTREETQQDLGRASEDPKVQAAMQNLAEQVTEGVLQALESERSQQRVSSVMRAVAQAAAQQMITALSGERTREQIALLAQSATDAALKQTSATLQTDVGPALRAALERDLAQGTANALTSDSMQTAIARGSQTFAHNAVLGWNSGVSTAWERDEGALHNARALPGLGRSLLLSAGVLLGLIALIAVSLAVMLVARARQAHSEVARLERATLLLATAMREKQATQQTDEILAVVQQALEGRAERTGKHRILDALRIRKSG